MLFSLFVVFQLIHSISSVVVCHVCPIDQNSYDYLVTADKIPYDLRSCTLSAAGDVCYMDIIWNQMPDRTQIGLSSENDRRMVDTNEQALFTQVTLEQEDLNVTWERRISYKCSTDQCNGLSDLKRLLNSLTFTDNFNDLKFLLEKQEPFDGNWCTLSSNSTTLQCDINIPPVVSCKQCSFEGISRHGSVELCASCLRHDVNNETFLTHEVDFNMTDRTRADHWVLECAFKDCNTYDYGNLIRQKSTSDFDFAKFLDRFNRSTTLSSISKTILFFVVCFLQMLY